VSRCGGTRAVDLAKLPEPVFRSRPNGIVTAAQTLGPCHVNDVPEREDVSEGKVGLPMPMAVRIVHAPPPFLEISPECPR